MHFGKALLLACWLIAASVGNSVALGRSALALVVDSWRVDALITSLSTPCLAVVRPSDPRSGYAILREPLDPKRMILAALGDIPGIEDPLLLPSGSPNFFADAWNERQRLAKAGPVGTIALAINSKMIRSQDRLHIHIGCLAPSVRDALLPRVAAINPSRFARLNFRLHGRAYWAMRIEADNLDDINPFQLLAKRMPGASANMARHSLLLADAVLPSGEHTFILLTNHYAPPRDVPVEMESLLDATCAYR